MEIPRLLKKRQLNVREQNATSEHQLLSEAKYWQAHPLPRALISCGKERGILWSRSIVLELDIDYPGLPSLVGTILTEAERFIEFELETDEAHETIISVEKWHDVTGDMNFSEHNKGSGAGYGVIAIKVKKQLLDIR